MKENLNNCSDTCNHGPSQRRTVDEAGFCKMKEVKGISWLEPTRKSTESDWQRFLLKKLEPWERSGGSFGFNQNRKAGVSESEIIIERKELLLKFLKKLTGTKIDLRSLMKRKCQTAVFLRKEIVDLVILYSHCGS